MRSAAMLLLRDGAARSGPPPAPREIDSEALLRGARVIVIRHGQSAYRLQTTAAGKLILTK